MRFLKLLTILMMAMLCSVSAVTADETVHSIVLNNGTASLDGTSIPEYDYVWHADPETVHDEVKNAPAEYFTGSEPSGEDAVYIAHDIYYFPEVPVDRFKQVRYDDEWEWAYYYPNGKNSEYIWALLPVQGSSVPVNMMHNEAEAMANPVLHITKAGTYELSGQWHGQIWIDLGDQDDTFSDEDAKVTLILNGVDVTCDVAPALVFYSVYEADNGWEDRKAPTTEVDISNAGARVIIADNSENTFTGTNVYRMLKAKYKDEESAAEVKVQKKQRKMDGAFYSFRSMLIDGQEKGNGVLNIIAGYEGLNTELHLTLNGGKVNIQSQDDSINVNEDGISVLTINGGELHIVAGLGAEGDGVDSNGYLVINGGVVIAAAKPQSDSGLDSDMGSFINGGYVVATGSTMDWPESDSSQVTMNLQFASNQASDEAIIITDLSGKVIFAYDPDKDETTGSNNRGYRGAVISSPEFKVGETYNVYVGGDVEGDDIDGLYDIATVRGFSGAAQQVYTGTGDFGRGRPGMGPGPGRPGGRPEGGPGRPDGPGGFPGGPGGPGRRPDGEMGHPPMGDDPQPGGFPGGPGGPGGPGRRPDGKMGRPPMGDGPQPGGFPGGPENMPGDFPGWLEEENGSPSTDFFMKDTVNAFSGVKDEEKQEK